MNFSLVTIIDEDLNQYKADMQEAFQKGFEDVFGKTEDIILPEKDIDNSLNQKNSVAYKAVVDGEMVGGAVVVIDEKTQHNHLDFLYVKCGTRSKCNVTTRNLHVGLLYILRRDYKAKIEPIILKVLLAYVIIVVIK